MAAPQEKILGVEFVASSTILALLLAACAPSGEQAHIQEQRQAAIPLARYHFSPTEFLTASEIKALQTARHSTLISIDQWVAINGVGNVETAKMKGKDDLISFRKYDFANGESLVLFPDAEENYNNSVARVAEMSWFQGESGKILYSYFYWNPDNPSEVTTFLGYEWDNEGHLALGEGTNSQLLKKLGPPTRLIISNPHSEEEIIYKIGEGEINELFNLIGANISSNTRTAPYNFIP